MRVKEIKDTQKPFAIIVSCSDSRVSPEIVFDQGLGDLFIIRTAGNVLHDYELGSIEYAVEHLNVKTIYVMGHTNCGAVKAMLGEDNGHPVPGHIHSIIEGLKNEPEIQAAIKNKAQSKNITEDAVEANVKFAINQIRTSEPILKEKFNKKETQIFGGIYNLENGKIKQLTN
ncbi:Carbonic anhydrase [compost metagenome]